MRHAIKSTIWWVPVWFATVMGCPSNDDPTSEQKLLAATSESGASAAFASSRGKAKAWTAVVDLVVPDGAELLVLSSIPGLSNAALTGASVQLASPDGLLSVSFAAGDVALTGFDPVDLTSPASDPTLMTYLDGTLLAGLPEEPTDEDLFALRELFSGSDPEHPLAPPPTAVMDGIDAGEVELRALRNAVAIGADAASPEQGLVVFGPSPGVWTLTVTTDEGAGDFEAMAWVLPAGGDGAALDAVAEALAAASERPATKLGALGPGEGEDPGGAWHLDAFRNPPAWSPNFFRAKAYQATYTVVQWLILRGVFTKAIDVLLKLDGTAALVTAGVTKDQLKTASIFCVAMIYRNILKNAGLADLWFWRIAYSLNSPDNYHRVFYLGNVVREGVFERFTFKPEPIVLGLNDFEERELLGGNMVQDPLKRQMWGFADSSEAPKVGKWKISPTNLALVKPRGQQDGDCTIESVMGQTTPGKGTLTVVVATQPARLEVPVTVAAELVLTASPAKIQPGSKSTLTLTGTEGLDDPVTYAWRTAGIFGTLSDGAGHSGRVFELSSRAVTYEADSDAPDQSSEEVEVTVYVEPAEGPRVELGKAEAVVEIGVVAPRCKVELGVYDAPEDWTSDDPNPADVTCELSSGVWVIDPDTLSGCYSSSSCVLQCKGWSDPQPAEFIFQWGTYDEDGNYTGGNICNGGNAGDCATTLTWIKSACADNYCMPSGGFHCAGCGCGCGGGNCYPWTGPGKIVFDAYYNLPCTDAAECYYYGRPGHTHGGISFDLVHCGTVDNALPNCPGNVPE